MSRARSFLAASLILATSLTAIPALSQTSRTASRGEYLARIMIAQAATRPAP